MSVLFLLGLFVFHGFSGSAAETLAEIQEFNQRQRMIHADEFLESPAGRYYHHGDYENALKELEVLTQKFPGDTLVRRYYAMTLEQLGRSGEAAQIFEQMVSKKPSYRDIWVDRAFKANSGPFGGILPPTHGENFFSEDLSQACVMIEECRVPVLSEEVNREVW